MASWQAKHRDPLFDQNTQAALERRGKELAGAGLIVLGVLVAMMLGSWSAEDPSFLSATDAPAQNLLGSFGAYVASPLMMIAGYGSWVLVLAAFVWGLRLMLHRSEERIMRGIFTPIAVALASVYCSTLTPTPDWQQNYGLGGHFGDMVMGAMLTIIPMKAQIGIRLAALIVAAGALAAVVFVLGFDRTEIRAIWRRFLIGLVTAYDVAMRLAGRGAVASAGMAQRVRARRAQPVAAADTSPRTGSGPSPRIGVRARRAAQAQPEDFELQEEMPEPELIERDADYDGDGPSAEEVSGRISDAIRNRTGKPSVLAAVAARLAREGARDLPRAEPPVTAATPSQDEEFAIEPAEPVPFGADHQRVVVPPARKPISGSSKQARAEAEPQLRFDETETAYERPPLALLTAPTTSDRTQISEEALMENARMLEAVLDDYGVKGQITEVRPGPVVTLYELEPAPGLKASRVIGLADDIARSMSALSARVSTVPGRSVIGIELPNARREKVLLREIFASRAFGDGTQPLPLALGKDIGGDPVVANLAKMPHLLIAGTTGSGKSVAINTMILSLLYKLTPDECRLIMIDPKMLELSVYDGIPHLLSPVVTDPKKAVVALKWVVGEMEDRYRKMSKMGVRNIEGYNGRVREALSKNEMFKRTVQTGFDEDTGEPIFETEEFQPETFPYIVVIVDEMADLMMVAGKEIEACIQRLAQMARASGIHLIMATQRPSVDVITGTIKANFPTRISFQVTSKIDSRTILGEQGAEQLLGQGDMLYMGNGARITRVHGPFVSDEEVEEVVTQLKSFGPPSYQSGVVEGPDEEKADNIDAVLGLGGGDGGDDQLYDQAVMIVAKDRKCSTSYIQRKLAIGYNKAARLVEQMEDQGVVSSANHVGKREVLVPEV
ncbi:DNA translocase FtsK 4TM domain-containing protein [Paracoccus sp. R12_1]|uniref:DNA translocase FtsK n=1 Tax=unclassified Paracoccus (in: a-proteobacteria) TaxID=2688777 RepID=UPI001ADC6D7F|nr:MULTISPECIES: DNA translocase FtsK [unclassified Paracoccus (in: a-proteobacteria)]MBO9453904.1 DNA translocase FtsK 4TM domain-containing protein [Paracoccus sp. R12_2]MBO9485748.1 DNA translocase FtsK 4TM domain-containing protein [Paracoccus sp. R12_1]